MELFSIRFSPILQVFVQPKWFIKIKMCNSKNQYPELFYFKRMENKERFGKPETYSFCGELPPFFVLKEITLTVKE